MPRSGEAFAQKKIQVRGRSRAVRDEGDPKGELAQAKSHFEEAIANEYRVAEAHAGIGEVYFLEARYDEAEQEFTMATQGPEPVAAAYAGLGLIAMRKEDKARAQEQFEKALALDDGLWRGLGLGLLAIDRGDLVAAEELFEEAEEEGLRG